MTDSPFNVEQELSGSSSKHAAKEGNVLVDVQAELHAIAVASMGTDFFIGVSKYLQSHMISNRFNQLVFKACEELYASEIDISIGSIRNYILSIGHGFDMVLWQKYIDYYSISGAHKAALRVRELYFRRQLKSVAEELMFKCSDISEDVFEIYEDHKASVSSVYDEVSLENTHDVTDVEAVLMKSARDAMEGKIYGGAKRTGLRCVDDAIYGLMPGDLLIIAARPGMGKTTAALEIARRLSITPNPGVKPMKGLIFTLESNKKRTTSKIACAIAGINSENLKSGRLSHSDLSEYEKAIKMILNSAMVVYDNPDMKISDMRAIAARENAIAPISYIILDYIQLMTPSRRGSNREQEVAEITRGLKKLALKLDVPIIALSQLNRKVEDRPGCVPQMSDIRESGSAEQDADVIILLYCAEVYGFKQFGDGTSTEGVMEWIYAKNREGSLKKRVAEFVRVYGRIENMSSVASDEIETDTPF